MLLQEESLRAELYGIIVPAGCLTLCIGRCRRAFVLDRVDCSVFLLDEVELAGQSQLLGSKRDTTGVDGIPFPARPTSSLGIIDTPMFDSTVLYVVTTNLFLPLSGAC